MVEHEGILSLPGVLMHVLVESMSFDITIGNFPIRFNEILGHAATSPLEWEC